MLPCDCSLIIPASGFSERFGAANKLQANLSGRPLADYAAKTASKIGFREMIAVVPDDQSVLETIFKAHGFQVVHNANSALGKINSIKVGAKSVSQMSKAMCVMLADMPLVPVLHIQALLEKAPEDGIIKTHYNGHSQPPAIFSGRAMQAWLQPEKYPGQEELLPLTAPFGEDVDTQEDLKRMSSLLAN